MGNGRELPCSRCGRPHLGVDMHINDAWASISYRRLHGGRQVLTTGHCHAISTAGARPRRKIRVIALATRPLFSLIEASTELTTIKQAVLEVSYCTPGEVVPHNPYTRKLILDGSGHDIRRHHESAIAHH